MKMTNQIFILLIFLGLSWGSCSENKDGTTRDEEDIVKVPLGDPFIMYFDGVYYAYGTFSEDGIIVFSSTDLKNWEIPKELVNGLALQKSDVWGDKWFWAPEVYSINGKFYMYYSADEHICVATSDNPWGPFTQEEQKPMITDEKCIDNSLFIDEDGTPWLYFVRFNDGNNIWVAELEENLIDIKQETMKPCIHVSQEWETVWPRVNEGPFVIRHNGIYYMTYSANSYESPFYGVGYATSQNPEGPWIKYEGNPILQKPGELVGAGHSAMFHDESGSLKIVFHAHNNEKSIHPRHMYVSTVSFEDRIDGQDVMVIDSSYTVPQLKTN
ncbi:glycoside hydrolase family 43 protein [Thermophagus sp. OGC60D27]|uniref:glycoside hydrolase family 43 protein n=1 Tax=Thermophagus sp. OGC60D27 TaxID=3458415 RepID=UPI004037A11B